MDTVVRFASNVYERNVGVRRAGPGSRLRGARPRAGRRYKAAVVLTVVIAHTSIRLRLPPLRGNPYCGKLMSDFPHRNRSQEPHTILHANGRAITRSMQRMTRTENAPMNAPWTVDYSFREEQGQAGSHFPLPLPLRMPNFMALPSTSAAPSFAIVERRSALPSGGALNHPAIASRLALVSSTS